MTMHLEPLRYINSVVTLLFSRLKGEPK